MAGPGALYGVRWLPRSWAAAGGCRVDVASGWVLRSAPPTSAPSNGRTVRRMARRVAAGPPSAVADPRSTPPFGVATLMHPGGMEPGRSEHAACQYRQPYDPARPAEDPPEGAERLMCYLAERVAMDHVPDGRGWCRAPSCLARHEAFPCVGIRMANVGRLWAALGPWAEHQPGRVVPRQTPRPSSPSGANTGEPAAGFGHRVQRVGARQFPAPLAAQPDRPVDRGTRGACGRRRRPLPRLPAGVRSGRRVAVHLRAAGRGGAEDREGRSR